MRENVKKITERNIIDYVGYVTKNKVCFFNFFRMIISNCIQERVSDVWRLICSSSLIIVILIHLIGPIVLS